MSAKGGCCVGNIHKAESVPKPIKRGFVIMAMGTVNEF
jgi:hypothetical protein